MEGLAHSEAPMAHAGRSEQVTAAPDRGHAANTHLCTLICWPHGGPDAEPRGPGVRGRRVPTWPWEGGSSPAQLPSLAEHDARHPRLPLCEEGALHSLPRRDLGGVQVKAQHTGRGRQGPQLRGPSRAQRHRCPTKVLPGEDPCPARWRRRRGVWGSPASLEHSGVRTASQSSRSPVPRRGATERGPHLTWRAPGSSVLSPGPRVSRKQAAAHSWPLRGPAPLGPEGPKCRSQGGADGSRAAPPSHVQGPWGAAPPQLGSSALSRGWQGPHGPAPFSFHPGCQEQLRWLPAGAPGPTQLWVFRPDSS